MKRTLLFGCAAFVLASCTKVDTGMTGEDRTELRLTSGIEVVTRGEIQDTEIEPGETVWAWVSDAGTGKGLYTSERLTAQAEGMLTGTKPMYFPQTGNAVNIRALHGTFSGTFETGTTPFPESIGFTVAEDQSEGTDAYLKSDLLYAASDNVSRTKSAVPLTFYHMLSKLELKIVRGEGVTDAVTKVTLDGVAVDGIFTPAGTDLTEQENRAAMVAAGGRTGTMTLGAAFVGDDPQNHVTNDAIVVPQAIGGRTMTFTLSSGGELVYTIPEVKKFESGRKHVYTVTLKGTELSVDSTIEPWDDSEGETDGEATLPPPPAKIGDYFYSDGTYSTELNPDKEVIGIVFQTDLSRIGQAEKDVLKAKGIDEPHGLVMSVKNAATDQQWGPMSQDEGLTKCDTKADNYNDISGYGNCDHIRTNRKGFDSHPAFKAADGYNTICPVPASTTGWYLPASGQWWDILQNLGGCTALADEDQQTSSDNDDFIWSGQGDVPAALNAWMEKIASDGKDNFNSGDWFWSSSEYSDSRARLSRARLWGVYSHGGVYCYWGSKVGRNGVRPVLAF